MKKVIKEVERKFKRLNECDLKAGDVFGALSPESNSIWYYYMIIDRSSLDNVFNENAMKYMEVEDNFILAISLQTGELVVFENTTQVIIPYKVTISIY